MFEYDYDDYDGEFEPLWDEGDDGQPNDLTENEDFAHDNDLDNYIIEDQHLDGMFEE